jgi:hypothetical protein
MRESLVRAEPHPTRSLLAKPLITVLGILYPRSSQTLLIFAPFGTDNDFNRPSGTGLFFS